jgi:hypothetical protein
MTVAELLALVTSLVFVPHAARARVVPSGFDTMLRCPFAKVWIEHGPEHASKMLGVAPHRRLEDVVFGTCKFKNPFAGDICIEMRGTSWSDLSAMERCDNAMPGVKGELAKGGKCEIANDFAGWCSMKEGTEFMPTTGDCKAAKDSCVQWSAGSWTAAGACADTSSSSGGDQTAGSGGDQMVGSGDAMQRCAIGPGPIGAAHQHAQSPGYDNDCPGTPAQQSPFMWPLRWSAKLESKGYAFGSDKMTYESRGQVWYMLDKNWKRLDTFYQKGVHRTIGQSPCPEEQRTNGVTFGCTYDEMEINRTMLHRNNKMFFIEWSKDGHALNCSWLDLSVIGNIRPDWFMDDRGSATDVQYIGDSHVYYMDEPKLVKQWRKKDFANQYFTMSMQRLAGDDGVHWPLILNVPGEGFGDDFLQHWSDHRLLSEAEESAFLLDEQIEAAGGKCIKIEGSGGSGPPTGEAEHVLSNLEVEEVAWRKVVYTASPVWKPEAEAAMGDAPGMVRISKDAQAEACFDEAASMLRLTLNANMPVPNWAAVSFRGTSECLMTPRAGGNSLLVLAKPDSTGAYSLSHGLLTPNMKHFQADSMSAFDESLIPLSQKTDFNAHFANMNNGKLEFGFAQKYESKPASIHLTFAIGQSPKIGYHSMRECFELSNLPSCPKYACSSQSTGDNTNLDIETAQPVSGTSTPTCLLAFATAIVALIYL